jgi:hypothetical protein
MGAGEVHVGGGDVEQLLTVVGDRLGNVDDLEDLGPPKRVICPARI